MRLTGIPAALSGTNGDWTRPRSLHFYDGGAFRSLRCSERSAKKRPDEACRVRNSKEPLAKCRQIVIRSYPIETASNRRDLMWQTACAFLLIITLPGVSRAMEVAGSGPLRDQDWWQANRIQWATDSINYPTLEQLRARVGSYATTNTFILAFDYNLRHNQPAEYMTVTQRNNFYDYATLLIEGATAKPEVSQVRFFHAATIVTSWSALGAIDNPKLENPTLHQVAAFLGPNTADQNDAVTLLRDINAQLFAENLPIINNLLYVWNEPRDPQNGQRTLSALEFDLAMVDLEQNTVQNILSSRRPRPEILKTIGTLLRFRHKAWAWDNLGGGHPLDVAMRWAEDAGYHPNDFANMSNRIALGRALVFFLHGPGRNQTQSAARQAYLDYMSSNRLPAPAATADDEAQWQSWTAGQAILMAGDSRGIVPVLYGIGTREALLRPEGSERQAVVGDFADAIRRARDIHTFADYQELASLPALKQYSVAEALPPFSISGWDSVSGDNAAHQDPGSIEKMYRAKIVAPTDPGVLVAAGRIIPAAGQVISDLSAQVYSVPASTSDWNWNVLKTAPVFAGSPAANQLASLMQSPQASLPSVLSTVANAMDGAAVARAQQAVDTYRSSSAAVSDLSSLAHQIQTNGLPLTDIEADMSALQGGARGVAAVAQLFGDEKAAQEASRIASTVQSSVKVFQAAKLLLASTTASGAFLAVGGLTSALGGLFGGSSSDTQVLNLMHEMFDYMKQQFSVVNQKLDTIATKLDDIQQDIKAVRTGVDDANVRLELVQASLGRIEVSLADIENRLQEIQMIELNNCIGYSRDNATFRADDNGALSVCVSRYLDLLSRASREETISIGNLDTPQDLERLEDDFVKSSAPEDNPLDTDRAASLLSGLTVLEAQRFPAWNLPSPAAVNAAFVWQAVTGLTVFDHDFSAILPWTSDTATQIKAFKSEVDAVDSLMKSVAGKTSADRISRTATLAGKMSNVSEPPALTNMDWYGPEQTVQAPQVTVADPQSPSYARALRDLNKLLIDAGEDVINDTVQYLSTKDALNGQTFTPIYVTCPSTAAFQNAIYSPVIVLDPAFEKGHFPPIYFTQGGRDTSGHREWKTYGSVTGPAEICVELATISYPAPNINIRYATWVVTATITVRFAGHVLQTFTNVIKEQGCVVAPRVDAKEFWFSLLGGGCTQVAGSDDLPGQISNVLNSHQDEAKQYTREALRARILFGNSGSLSTWATEVHNAALGTPTSTVRGRFLRDLAKKLQQPGTDFALRTDLVRRELEISAAILRVHVAVAMPDFVQMADPLRIVLAGPPGVRLLDGGFVSDALQCVTAIPDVSRCDKRVSDVIEAGFFEKAGTVSANQLVQLNSILFALPVNDRLNTGHPYFETLSVRFEALIKSIESQVPAR